MSLQNQKSQSQFNSTPQQKKTQNEKKSPKQAKKEEGKKEEWTCVSNLETFQNRWTLFMGPMPPPHHYSYPLYITFTHHIYSKQAVTHSFSHVWFG